MIDALDCPFEDIPHGAERVRPIAHGSKRLCLAGWSTVAFPFAETGRRSGVRVAEPGLSPHSSCWQRDVRCRVIRIAKTKKPVDFEVAGFSARLRWLSVRWIPDRAAHQIGTHCARDDDKAALFRMQACSHHIVCGWPDRTGHTPCLRRARNSEDVLAHIEHRTPGLKSAWPRL